jgi:hypothetical protein
MKNQTPFSGEGIWLKGNLHCHSTVSDGVLSPPEVASIYRDAGYDFLALTDHDTFTNWRQLEGPGFFIVPGVETAIEDKDNKVCYHFVGLADKTAAGEPLTHLEAPPFPRRGDQTAAQSLINSMKQRALAVIFCHPVWSRTEVSQFLDLDGYFAVEVYNHGCHVECNTGLAPVYWDSLLRHGKRIWGVATDDSHQRKPDSLGGWVTVKATGRDAQSVVTALLDGKFYSSSGPTVLDYGIRDGEVYIECSPVREIHFVSYEKRGESFVCKDGATITGARHALSGSEKYVRVECVDEHGYTAWTNPLFLER